MIQDISNQNWHSISIKHSFELLKTSSQGLSTNEVKHRKKIFNLNKLRPPKKRSALLIFLNQFNNILIYILLICGVITVFLQHWVDMSVIFGVVILNAIVGTIQEGKAEKALDAIRNMLSLTASVIRDGKRHTINAEDLVPGDITLLQPGDKVPADLRIFESHSLQIQEAVLTGESVPVDKFINSVSANASLGDRHSMAYSGTLVSYGIGQGMVVATGEHTEIGHISTMLKEVKPITTPLIQQMAVFSRWLTGAIVLMSLSSFAVGALIWSSPIKELFMATVGIAVATIPEGLPALITITLAIGVTRMAKRNAIIRRLPAVETMGAVSVICTDKTGTLTRNELAASIIVTAEHDYNVTGTGYNNRGQIMLEQQRIDPQQHPNLLAAIQAVILCNNSELSKTDGHWQLHGNPTDGALLSVGLKTEFDLEMEKQNFPRTDLIPFQSEHKFMATLHHDHDGNGYIFAKGAPEKILTMCDKQILHNQKVALDHNYWDKKINELAYQGQRVVAIATKITTQKHRDLNYVDIESGMTLLGIIGIIDPPREEAIKAVADCQKAGMRIKMITGDHAETARAIANLVGIHDGHGVLIGLDLDEMTDEELATKVNDIDIYARTSPKHKLRLVKALQSNGQIVAMTGDGVNDAPALKQAEIGVAMGIKGTEAAKEAAEMVLTDDNFSSIRHAIEEGRTVYDNIKKAILYILPTNTAEGFSVMFAILFGYMLPITAVQILWVNMISAITLALALGFELPESNVMHRPPRAPNEPILSRFLVWRIVFVSSLLVLAIFGLFVYERNIGTSINVARTVVVNMLVVGQIAYLINCRRIFSSVLSWKGIFGSRPILIAIALVLFFQLLFTYTPFMQHFFHSTPIDLNHWLKIIVLGIIIFLLVEGEKMLFRFASSRN